MRQLLICISVLITALLTSCSEHASDNQIGCYEITIIGNDYEQSTYHYGTREEAGVVLQELLAAATSVDVENIKTTIKEINKSESECIANDSSDSTKHDPFDDIIITGEVGPQVYWEIASSIVPAGSNVDFTAQYYTNVEDVTIDHSEVWYNITENIEKSVFCPWIKSFAYSVETSITEEKRSQQLIKHFEHSEDTYDSSLRAYILEDAFPISGALAPFLWGNPTSFGVDESTLTETYFGMGFMQHFKDSLYNLLNQRDAVYHSYQDFRSLFVGLGLSEDFSEFTDSTFDANSGQYIKHFKWNIEHTDRPIPAEVTRLYNNITFSQLIHNKTYSIYEISYKRCYYVRATLRVYDNRGVYGTSQAKDIEIN